MLGTDLVLFLALRARLASLSVAVLTYCLLVGMVASLVEVFFGVAPRSTASSGCSSPWLALSLPACPVSWALAFRAFCLVQVQGGCVSWPPVQLILHLPGLLGDCGFADV